jgi:hypothetical protein
MQLDPLKDVGLASEARTVGLRCEEPEVVYESNKRLAI